MTAALPVKAKTMLRSLNERITAQGTALATNKRLLRTIKDRLKSFASSPWVMRYSCNSSAAGSVGDGVDRWASDGDLVWANAGVAHSWTVLRQTGIATNFELLISCEGSAANGHLLTLVVSPSAAFTGGSTTARPTATDEIVLLSNAVWGGASTFNNDTLLHIWQSTDGQCTRLVVCQLGWVQTFWLFDRPNGPSAGWTNPSVSVAVATSGSHATTYTNLVGAGPTVSKGRGAATMGLHWGVESISGDYAGVAAGSSNHFDGTRPMMAVGLWSDSPVASRCGSFYDLWVGLESTAVGSHANDSGPDLKKFVQLGAIILDWDGGAAVQLT